LRWSCVSLSKTIVPNLIMLYTISKFNNSISGHCNLYRI
jgi:hypothetical protein